MTWCFFRWCSNLHGILQKLKSLCSASKIYGKSHELLHQTKTQDVLLQPAWRKPSRFTRWQPVEGFHVLGVSNHRGKTPKMDGENNGNTLWTNGWFGGKTHHFRKHPFPRSDFSTRALSVSRRCQLAPLNLWIASWRWTEPWSWMLGWWCVCFCLEKREGRFLGCLGYIYIYVGGLMLYIVISSLCGVYKVLYKFFFSNQLCDQCGNCGDYFKKKHCEDPYVKEPVLFWCFKPQQMPKGNK